MLEVGDPFGFGALHYVRSVDDSKALNTRDEPMIIISASGMCEAGRILHHLKNNIGDSRNTVLLVSFQAENTLGRRIQERREQVSIFGERYPLKAHVESIDGYSAHADRKELLGYFQKLQPQNLKRAFIVHGDEEASSSLEEGLKELGVRKTKVPKLGEKVTI
jgi:metallo-beta-lactamase family protein